MTVTVGSFTYGGIDNGGDHPYEVGKFCSIGQNVRFFKEPSHRVDWVTTFPFGHSSADTFPYSGEGHPRKAVKNIIGNDVWFGSNAMIKEGVNISDGAVIAANSYVVKDVGPYEIVGGNPARLIRKRFTDEQINSLLRYKWWDMDNHHISELIPYLCSDNIDAAIAKMKEMFPDR